MDDKSNNKNNGMDVDELSEMKKMIDQSIRFAESEYKVFDSTMFLIRETQARIIELAEKQNKTKYDNYCLAVEVFKLKAFSKLSIVESLIKKNEERK